MNSIYRPILKQAVQMVFKFKYLWFFGLFAALLGNGGAYNFGLQNLDKVENQGAWMMNLKQVISDVPTYSWDFVGIFQSWSLSDALVFLLVIVAGAFFIWLSIASEGALIHGLKQGLKGKGSLFKEAMQRGSHKFWPIAVLYIILNVVLFIAVSIILTPFVILTQNIQDAFLQLMAVMVSFIILVPVGVMFYFVVKYAEFYVINEDKHVGAALASAWGIFKKNWVASLEMGILLFLINILTSLALVIVLIFLALPFVLLWLVASTVASETFVMLVLVLGLLTFIAVMFFYGLVINIFQNASWLILFEKLKGGAVESKVERVGSWFRK